MATDSSSKLFGQPVRRLEDRPLVTGKGRYLDDLQPEGCLAAAFVRSPYAHAAFSAIDKEAASVMPGVVAVYTLADLSPHLTADRLVVGLPSSSINMSVDRPILASSEVVHVGEAIAVVIAESRSQAEDAAETIDIDFEQLPVVSDCRQALAEAAHAVHSHLDHNCLARFGFAYGEVDAAFRKASQIVAGSYRIHRGGSHSMEGRGVLAKHDRMHDLLEVWSSTQTPPALKKSLCDLLGRDEDRVRVTVPDVGGGFGPKLVTYPEEIVVALAAILIGQPVKWVEDRREHFVSTTQERDQFWDMEMALDAEGLILGIRGDLIHDHGAYTARGLNVPYGSGVTLPLPYNVPAYKLDIAVALTNKVPVTPVRGAGQPQAAFVMERLMDRAALATGLDPDEIRRRNLVRADQMPCRKPLKLRGGTDIVLDSGDYPACQESALRTSGWHAFRERQCAARAQGRRIGMGMANYVEGTGRGPYEGVSVKITRTGHVVVSTGAAAMGQGTATMIAQIVGEHLGGDMDNVAVRTGESEQSMGFGGFNSRQTVVAGASAQKAALEVRQKMLKVASHLMEAHEDDLDVLAGRVAIKGVEGKSISFGELAAAAIGLPGYSLPGIDTPGLVATGQVTIDDMAYSNGSAVAEVEVDEETGHVRIIKFTLAHDCGRMVNPVTVDGQIVGGIAHGVGNALFEEMIFDEAAQPLTTTFADYLLVTAEAMPEIAIHHSETPSPLNTLGVKGVGESGVISVTGAVAAAIDDALSDLGLHVDTVPVSPQALLERIRTAKEVSA